MYRLKYFAIIALAFFPFVVLLAQINAAIDNQVKEDYWANHAAVIYEQSKQMPNGTQLALGVVIEDKMYWYGIERQNDTIRTVENKDSVFEIGSITKVFTANLLASAIMEEKVTKATRLSSLFPSANAGLEEVTLAHLANHTSGLPRLPGNMGWFVNIQNPYEKYDVAKLEAYLQGNIKLADSPGATYSYSNLGAGILGYVLSEQAQLDYEGLLQREICEPYGMKITTTDRAKVANRLVHGQDYEGKRVSNWDLNALVAAGGILSTTYDMTHFMSAQLDTTNIAFQLAQQPTFKIDEQLSMGLGWHILQRGQQEYWWHNGGTGGYTSSLALDIENKYGVVVLSNVSAFSSEQQNIDKLTFALLDSFNNTNDGEE